MKVFTIFFINNKGEKLELMYADWFCTFVENYANELILVGSRRANKLSKKLNGSKYLLKQYQDKINKHYKSNHIIKSCYTVDTGYLWNYREEVYYYPQ